MTGKDYLNSYGVEDNEHQWDPKIYNAALYNRTIIKVIPKAELRSGGCHQCGERHRIHKPFVVVSVSHES